MARGAITLTTSTSNAYLDLDLRQLRNNRPYEIVVFSTPRDAMFRDRHFE